MRGPGGAPRGAGLRTQRWSSNERPPMRTTRRAASLLLLVPVLLMLTACEAPPTQTAPEREAATSTDAALSSVPLGIEPNDPAPFEAAVQGGEWGAVWNELAWDISADFEGQIRLWGVLVVNGEQRASFLTDPVAPTARGRRTFWTCRTTSFPPPTRGAPGPSGCPGRPTSFPTGPRAAPCRGGGAFFESNAWFPAPE